MKRFTYFLISITLAAPLARPLHAQAPVTTTVNDVVYRGDGTPASGTLLISWPAFETSDGRAVAAGSKSVTLGAGGTLNVALVPNENAVPAGSFYRVIYKLNDGSTSEELWSVPALSPTTIAAVRATIVPSGVAMQVASRQYVDSAIAAATGGTGTRFHSVRFCDMFTGANAGQKIQACIADLPASGGVADARGFEGTQTISADPFTGVTKPVYLILGAATFSVTVNVTVPRNVSVVFSQGGSLSIATGTATTIRGPVIAPLSRLFTLAGTGIVSFSGNNSIRDVYPQWWGAVGDGSADDTAAIQQTVAALESANITDTTITAALARVFFPQPIAYYKTTAPIDVTKSYVELAGTSTGVRIVNATSGSDVIRVNNGATASPLFGVTIRNLWLKGTGNSSRALYMNGLIKPVVKSVSFISHPGTCIYQESMVTGVTGTNFGDFESVECQPSQAVTGIYDRNSVQNTYKNVRVREAEVGLDIVSDTTSGGGGTLIQGSLFEANNRGTAKIGIRARGTGQGANTNRRSIQILASHFEGNSNYAIDADKAFVVDIQDTHIQGSVDGAGAPVDQLRLDGGGFLRGSRAGGARVISNQGIVEVENSWGFYGKVSQLRIRNASMPLGLGGTNSATKSWFDTDPAWTTGGTTPPTLSHDTSGSNGFYGSNAKKATFASGIGAGGFSDSRVRLDNTAVAQAAGDMYSIIVASKQSASGRILNFRSDTDGAQLTFTSDTDWNFYLIQSAALTSTTHYVWLHPAIANLSASTDVWVGGVAVASNAEPILINTEWAARAPYDVDFQNARMRSLTLSGAIASTLPTGTAPFTIASTTPVANLSLASDSQLPLVGLARGGTNRSSSWTASRCVRVNDAGTALEPASADCGLGGGGGDNLTVNAVAASDANLKDGAISANDVPVKFALDTAPAPDDVTAKITTTDIRSVTFGNAAGFTWTFDAGATDPTLAFASGSVSLGSADLLFAADNARDIGAATASRPRDYFGAGRARVGPAISSFASGGQAYLNDSHNYAAVLNGAAADSTALAGVHQDNTTNSLYALGAFADSEHASGNRAVAAALTFDVKHGGAGTVTDLMGVTNSMTVASGAGAVTHATVFDSGGVSWNSTATLTDAYGLHLASNTKSAGAITTNYGIKVENQTAGSTNYSLFTGTGRVRLGDDLDFATDNADDLGQSGANRPRTGYFGTSVVAPTLNASTALQTNGTTRLDSAGNLNNVTLDAEGAGNTVSYPAKFWLSAAGCNNATAAPSFDLPASSAPAASCYGTSPHRFGALDFADGSALTATLSLQLPSDWTSTGGVDIRFIWFSGSTSTNSAVWTVRTACIADGEDLLNPTYNSEQTVADANNATANQRNSASITGITVTGCAAGETMYLRIGRDPANASDTLAATASLLGVEITARRQM